jgi:hypothetical protein
MTSQSWIDSESWKFEVVLVRIYAYTHTGIAKPVTQLLIEKDRDRTAFLQHIETDF